MQRNQEGLLFVYHDDSAKQYFWVGTAKALVTLGLARMKFAILYWGCINCCSNGVSPCQDSEFGPMAFPWLQNLHAISTILDV